MITKITHYAVLITFLFSLFSCENKKKIFNISDQPQKSVDSTLYSPTPSFTFKQNGMYSTGLACVDLNNNGYMDVVNANGNDMSSQPLTFYYSKEGGFTSSYNLPNYSDEKGYNSRVKIGDLNNDGFQDIVMITVFKINYYTPKDTILSKLYKQGCVKIYMNKNGIIPTRTTQVIKLNSFPFDIDLGDIDGDGDLDLAIANMGRLNSNDQFTSANSVIHLNKNGKIEAKESWKTDNSYNATSIKYADVNLDGLMDLTIGHKNESNQKNNQALSVFYGKLNAQKKSKIDTKVGWSFGFGKNLDAVSLKIGLLREGKNNIPDKKDIAFIVGVQASVNNNDKLNSTKNAVNLNSNGTPGQEFYVIGHQEKKIYWKTDVVDMKVQQPSFSTMGDVNNDGYADLVLGFFKMINGDLNEGAPFFIFAGNSGIEKEPTFNKFFTSKGKGVNQEICLTTTFQYNNTSNYIEQRSFTQKYTPNKTVVTLPCNVILSIDSVKVAGKTQSIRNYSWNYGSNLITLNNNIIYSLNKDINIEITYKTPLTKDIFVSYWNPNKGNVIYNSNYSKL